MISDVCSAIKVLYPTIKTMKTAVDDVVVVYNRHIIMISDDAKLSVLELKEDTGLSICCRYNDIEYHCNEKIGMDFAYNYDMPLFYRTIDIYNKYATSCNFLVDSVERFDLDYPDLVGIKSTDDYKLFRVNNILLSYVPGIMKLNKADTASLDIYKGIYPDTYILRFDVFKKKLNNTISIYLNQMALF